MSSASRLQENVAYGLPAMETLESRLLLSTSVSFSHGAWTITADKDPENPGDAISVELSDDGTKAELYVNDELMGEQLLSKIKSVKITGSAGDDDLSVDLGEWTGTTVILGGAGNDTITTGMGDDRIEGGAGDDTIDAGDGDNTVYGGDGDDDIQTGDGQDTIYGGAGDDTIDSGESERVRYNRDDEEIVTILGDTINGGDGNDRIDSYGGDDRIDSGAGDDVIDAGDGDNVVSGGDGDDQITTGSGQDRIDGGAGNDTIDSGDAEIVRTNSDDEEIVIIGHDTVTGGDDDDTITTGDGNNTISGGAGDDTITTGDGDNAVDGDDGDDTITTGAGEDRIDGGAGNDTIDSGDAVRTIQTADGEDYATGTDTIDGGAGDDTITTGDGNNVISGGAGDDNISAGAGDDTINGGAGDDTIDGGDGGDTINGGGGNDDIGGGAGDDDINGGRGNDQADGGTGDDDVNGSRGDDTLDGGDGSDDLNGGRGDDQTDGGAGSDDIDGSYGHNKIYSDADDVVRTRKWDVSMPEWNNSLTSQNVAELQQWLQAQRPRSAFGQWRYDWCYLSGGVMPLTVAYNTMDATTNNVAMTQGPTVGATTGSHSNTNTQVGGVDEGDIVETDGRYIYMITGNEWSSNGRKLTIISALPADEMKVVATLDIEGYASDLYLQGGKLTILSSTSREMSYTEDRLDANGNPVLGEDGEPLKNTVYQFNQQLVKMTVVDLADVTNPTVSEETYYAGTLRDSRAVGDKVYLVVDNNGIGGWGGWYGGWGGPIGIRLGFASPMFVNADYYLHMDDTSDVVLTDQQKALQAARDAWLDGVYEQEIQSMTPGYYKAVTVGGVQTMQWTSLDENCYVAAHPQNNDVMNIITADVGDDLSGPADETTIAGADASLYMNADSLYLTMTEYGGTKWGKVQYTDPVTQIYKFDLTDADVPFAAGGSVAGTVLNQYSMDEYNGYFRIVTTMGNWQDGRSGSLFVMQQQGNVLQAVSTLTDLGTNETVQSVRFMGDRAFVVTARQTDPLFAIDLSDPLAPAVKGELQMPGTSTYLQPVGENLIVGIGFDTTTWFHRNLKVSLYDVSDMSNPVEVSKVVYETGWSGSEAAYDPHALSYFEEYGVLALPVYGFSSCTDIDGHWHWTYEQNVKVLQLGEGGLSELGSVDIDGTPRRTVRIDDVMYSLSDKQIKATNVTNPADVIATLNIADAIQEAAVIAV